MKLVFENEKVLIADKPPGMLSVPSRLGAQDPRICLGIELQKKVGHPIFPVHRLDFEVSGICLFAKDAESHSLLSQAFEKRTVEKIYEAWTEGEAPEERHSKWTSKLLRGKKRAYESPVGKISVTEADYLGSIHWQENSVLSWRLYPKTGRPHQLRFHLFQHGFPIVGDVLYGSSLGFKPQAIALRAIELKLPAELCQTLNIPAEVRVSDLAAVERI